MRNVTTFTKELEIGGWIPGVPGLAIVVGVSLVGDTSGMYDLLGWAGGMKPALNFAGGIGAVYTGIAHFCKKA